MFESQVREIVSQLANTSEFRALKTAKEVVDHRSGLKNQVEQFLEDNAQAFQGENARPGRREEEMKKRFEAMMRVPEIEAYFDAAHRFEYVLFKLHEQIDRQIEETLEGK
ncbi:MAG TPA: YlbF family regulator [Selenomonadales bacterium]|nr:YlbF family regulator [Selenomonadales bacterium]